MYGNLNFSSLYSSGTCT